jgi:tetratricopeptide (TPR) repeat protein
MSDVLDALPVVPLPATDWAAAALVLEQAIKAGNQDPQATYLLAMCYKHLGRNGEAQRLLGKIANPDTNVLLQRGLLAFAERDFARAGGEFAEAWDKEPGSYPAAYNLLLARLCQGQPSACEELIPRVIALAPSPQERHFLRLFQTLLVPEETPSGAEAAAGEGETTKEPDAFTPEPLLESMSVEEESRLVDVLSGLGPFDIVFPLLSQLAAQRPQSALAGRAYFSAALVQGKQLMDRFQWDEAYSLLAAVARRLGEPRASAAAAPTSPPPLTGTPIDNMTLVALNSMLGTCSSMLQDFERGAWYFRAAQEAFHREELSNPRTFAHVSSQGVYQGAWLEQNLALAYEWQGKLDRAERHWNRYFDYLEHYFSSSRPADYLPKLAFEGLSRLADLYTKKEKWTAALGFLQRAHRVRPTDSDTLERLFHLYTQLKKPDDARRVLRRLREVRPNDPQVDLFEMDVREARSPEDIDKTLGDIRRILQRHAGDMRVEERAGAMINNLVPGLERLGEQYTHQLNKVIDQMRHLPSHEINWPVVRKVMRELEDKFFQLRRVAQKCLSLLTSEDLRRDTSGLITHCDRKIDQCHSLGE